MKACFADLPLTELGSCPAIFSADTQDKLGLLYTDRTMEGQLLMTASSLENSHCLSGKGLHDLALSGLSLRFHLVLSPVTLV